MGSLSEEVRTEVLCGYISNLEAENAKLRDEIKRRDELEGKLIRCIENDYGIMFSWDPLRKVWISECTDEYVTERERLDAENTKLRKLVRYWSEVVNLTYVYYENAEKLASKMSVIRQMMQELGIEVD